MSSSSGDNLEIGEEQSVSDPQSQSPQNSVSNQPQQAPILAGQQGKPESTKKIESMKENKGEDANGETGQDWRKFLLGIQQTLETSMKTQIADLKKDFKEGIEEVKNGQNVLQNELRETTQKCESNSSILKSVQFQLQTCQQKLNEVIDVTIK